MDSQWWEALILRAVEKYATPFYLFSPVPILRQLKRLPSSNVLAVENFLSLKTLPLRSLLKWWHTTNHGVEVTSEYELRAAQDAGYTGEKIIVNGVGKHTWNKGCWSQGLRVNFDSLEEIYRLTDIAKRLQWHIGVRFHPANQTNPDRPEDPDQFGITSETFKTAIDFLRPCNLTPEMIHIHLRSNIPSASLVLNALHELSQVLRSADITITSLDLGGGIPAEQVIPTDTYWTSEYGIEDLTHVIERAKGYFPSLRTLIFENGRFLLADSGVLVLSVVDIKEIHSVRFLLCNGGRTNHALPSDWEMHDLSVLPNRAGRLRLTVVCGPTCMAYDSLATLQLNEDVQIGDTVVWFAAGAYHLPWETRFSGPLANVIWHNQNELVCTRPGESFEEWWHRWH